MAYRSTYTSQISFPITLKWKCSKCGNLNSEETSMVVWRSITASVSKAAERMRDNLEKSWVNESVEIIEDPSKNPQRFRDYVVTNELCCSKCGKKEFWTTKQWYLKISTFLFLPAIISLIAVITSPKSLGAWAAFLVFGGSVIAMIVDEIVFKAKLRGISNEFKPQIIAHNEDIINFAKKYGRKIIIEDETANNISTLGEVPQNGSTGDNLTRFCPKCGKKLKPESGFCSYCGADLKINN